MKRRSIVVGLCAFVLLGVAAAGAIAWRPAIAPVAGPGAFDPVVVARGAQLASIGDCAVCHLGTDGTPYAGGRPVTTPFGDIYATNITPDMQTGIGTWSEAAFARSMREGVDRAGRFLYPAYPYTHYTRADAAEIGAIYAFLMTRAAVRADTPPTRLPFPLKLRPLMAGWNLLFLDTRRFVPDAGRSAEWNRGAYLVEGFGHCGACHTPRNLFGAERTDRAYTGGEADGWDAPGLTAASSPAAIAWTADALFDYLRQGVDDGHAASAGPMHAVSHNLSRVDAADVRAMAVYVASFSDPAGTAGADRARQIASRVEAAAAPPPELQATEGGVIFAGACAQCHGVGAPMMLDGRPSLALGSSVTAPSARNAAQTVLYGLQPEAGERGPYMPGFAGALTDRQVAAVLTYLRARFTDRPGWSGLEGLVQRIRGASSS